jgi:hypothetical protein
LGSLPNLAEVSLFALLGGGLDAFFVREGFFETPERFVDGLRGETLSLHQREHGATDVRRRKTILGAFKNILCSLKESGDLVFVIAGHTFIGYRKRCIHALIVPGEAQNQR